MSSNSNQLKQQVLDMDVKDALPIVQAQYPGYEVRPTPKSGLYHEIFYPNHVRLGHDDDNKVIDLIVG